MAGGARSFSAALSATAVRVFRSFFKGRREGLDSCVYVVAGSPLIALVIGGFVAHRPYMRRAGTKDSTSR